jgi:hypothetical protein
VMEVEDMTRLQQFEQRALCGERFAVMVLVNVVRSVRAAIENDKLDEAHWRECENIPESCP